MFNLLLAVSTALILSTSANASVFKTLNGTNYEWLELTETVSLSRDQIEVRLADSNDVLYGYQYASRFLVEELFLSYSGFDGLGGSHSATSVVNGAVAFFEDFGFTTEEPNFGTFISVEGETITRSSVKLVHGIYGLQSECNGTDISCFSQWILYFDENGTPAASWQSSSHGWDSSAAGGLLATRPDFAASSDRGSFLYRPVPVPSAAWLFISGLIGLIGFVRQNQ